MNAVTEKVYKRCGQILEDRSFGEDVLSVFDDIASIAKVDTDTVFRVLIGLKLTRVLYNKNVQDSLTDAANYCILWAAYKDQ